LNLFTANPAPYCITDCTCGHSPRWHHWRWNHLECTHHWRAPETGWLVHLWGKHLY